MWTPTNADILLAAHCTGYQPPLVVVICHDTHQIKLFFENKLENILPLFLIKTMTGLFEELQKSESRLSDYARLYNFKTP